MREENTEQREREELSRGIILMLLRTNQELQQENDELRSVNGDVLRENDGLRNENQDLRYANERLQRVNEEQQRVQEKLEKANEKLRRKNRELKQRHGALADKILKLSNNEKTARSRMEAEIARRKEAEKQVDELRRALAATLQSRSDTEEDLAEARSKLNMNSENSSRPPSSDPPGTGSRKAKAPNEHNTRTKTGKPQGGQPGHKGSTLTVETVRKMIAEGKCGHTVVTVGSGVGPYRTRFIVDTEMRVNVREYRIYANDDGTRIDLTHWKNPVIYGDMLRATVAQLYALGTLSHAKIAEFIRAQTEEILPMSTGTVYQIVRKMSLLAQPAIEELQKELLDTDVVFTDATQIWVARKQAYVRNFSTKSVVLLVPMESKSLDALKEIEFLVKYAGTLIHDHEVALYNFGSAHGECNVHLDRYLKGILELADSPSAAAMRSLLYEIKDAVERNKGSLDEQECRKYEQKYDEILLQWRDENSTRKYEFVRKKELSLINRLDKYKVAHLLFMYNKDVDFDNNLSERSVRPSKVHSRVTGGFRTPDGNQMCCNVFTIAQTSKLRGVPTIDAFRQLSASEFRASFLQQESPLVYGAYQIQSSIAE